MIKRNLKAKIISTGSYLPEYILSDEEIIRRYNLDISPKVLHRLFPVSERREARDESCSDMLAKAALNVLENACLNGFNVSPGDLDSIRVSITPGDYLEPSTASVVQDKIGARCYAYDVKMSCAGWLAGTYDSLGDLATGAKYTLVLAGMRTGNMRIREPRNRAIFGDGAGGFLLGNSENGNIKVIKLWTFGEFARDIVLPHQETVDSERRETFYMADGTKLYDILRKTLPELELEKVFDGIDRDSIDHLIVHKPSPRIHRGVEKYLQSLGFPRTKIVQNFDRYGNTVSADLPIALDEGIKQKRIKRGDRILLFSYGAGISAGAAIIDY